MRFASLTFIAFGLVISPAWAEPSPQLRDQLAAAKAGQTITLPAGEFAGGVVVPAGVSLQGAGYGKTMIDAKGAEHGITIIKGNGTSLRDLTVRGAAGTNIVVQGGEGVSLQRVRATGALIGINLDDVKSAHIENSISDGNRYGIVVTGGAENTIVNCTLAENSALGMSLPSGTGHVVFNNVITDSGTAVYVGGDARDLKLDRNLYLCLNVGRVGSQVPRDTLNNWRYFSGYDAHSVAIPIRYEDAAAGRFGATNVLDWALDRPVTAGWGASDLVDKAAPTEDIDVKKRPRTPGLGAFEATVKAPRPADGTLTVNSGSGVTSAGVFDAHGKLIAYLFQDLPLAKGDHPFWLPARSYKGRNIEPGEYEVRSVESRMDWEYVGWIANTETSFEYDASCPAQVDALAFDSAGHVIVGRDPSEAHDNLRGFDGATGKSLWVFDGNAHMRGLTTAADGMIYTLRADSPTSIRVTRVDSSTGKITPWSAADVGHVVLADGATLHGIAALGDKLYYTDPTKNAVRAGTLKSPEPTTSIEIKAPSSPAGDEQKGILWVISGGEKVVAISAEGKVIAETQVVPQPIALAARDGRSAIASNQTGKVHLFDSSDPASLKPLRTLGRGDGPDGALLPERFMFQDGAMGVKLALGPKQELAVGERESRLQVFDQDGKLLWSTFSTGGWSLMASHVTPGRVYVSYFTMMADPDTKTWRPESYHRALHGFVEGDMKIGGKTFVLMNNPQQGVSFVEFTPEKATPTIGIISKDASSPWTYRTDSNHDHEIDTKDEIVSTITDDKGQPVTKRIFEPRFTRLFPNGDLTAGGVEGWLTVWPCAGLDDKGYPIFRYQDRHPIPNDKADFISPYDFQVNRGTAVDHEPRPDGGWMCVGGCSGNPTKSWINNGGIDVIGIDKHGVVDWVHPFGQYPRVGSLDMAGDLYIASLGTTYDFFIMNSDGLSMQGFSFPPKARYLGHWVDHPDTVVAFTDAKGRPNVMTCDYMWNRNHWFMLRDKDVQENKVKLNVASEAAKRLAELPVPKLDVTSAKPAPLTIRIPRLKAPLPIDGELQKWRDQGIVPQVIVTSDAAFGVEGDATDCSAVARLAYHGQDLYFQVLRFDDVITTHQPQARAYMEDGVEFALNGALEGIKCNLAPLRDLGTVIVVDGWGLKPHGLDPKESPLLIKVLDNAEGVNERKLIESIAGVDLRRCKVQVFEGKVRLDAKTFAKRENAMFEVKPGQRFWIGFMINDNDQPGGDVMQNMMWPVTYGTFNPMEGGAQAILE